MLLVFCHAGHQAAHMRKIALLFVVTVHLVSSCASSLLGKMKFTVEGKSRVKFQRRLNKSFYCVVAEKHRAGLVVLNF